MDVVLPMSALGQAVPIDSARRMSAFRFLSPGNCHSGIGPSKSRLLRALVGRSTEVRLCSKADVRSATVIDHHGPKATFFAVSHGRAI